LRARHPPQVVWSRSPIISMTEATRSVAIQRYTRDGCSPRQDAVAVEEPLEIRVEGHSIAVSMRTPGHDRELAAGFLLSEGIISSASDVFEISTCPSASAGNIVDVVLSAPEKFDVKKFTRHVFTSSSCGLCGKATIESTLIPFPPLRQVPHELPLELILTLPERLREQQTNFQSTGGIHASALFDLSGNLLLLHEDVGRHNALDKVLGACLLKGLLPLTNYMLLLSGRISFELMQKSLAAGIPIIAAVGAPSSLAVEFAEQSGQALIGFIRDGRCNVYAPLVAKS
jgi:FdhD protein